MPMAKTLLHLISKKCFYVQTFGLIIIVNTEMITKIWWRGGA